MTLALALAHRTLQAQLAAVLFRELANNFAIPGLPTALYALTPGVEDDLAAVAADQAAALSVSDYGGAADTLVALIREYGRASAGQAAGYYREARTAAGVPGRFTPRLAEPAPPEQIRRSLSWATRALRPGTAAAAQAASEAAALQTSQTLVEGVARRLVTGSARATLLESGATDRVPVRWARVCAPTACYFCQLLAARGDTFISEAAARGGRRGYHNSCACTPQLLFPGQTWSPTASVRQMAEVYADSPGAEGTTAKLREFRRAAEGRVPAAAS